MHLVAPGGRKAIPVELVGVQLDASRVADTHQRLCCAQRAQQHVIVCIMRKASVSLAVG